MAKQSVNIGTIANDGTGSSIRAGGDIINDNFNEIYTALGDGSTLNVDTSGATGGEALIYNSGTGKFEPAAASGYSFSVDADSGSAQLISNGDTLNILGGTGLTSQVTGTDEITINIDSTVATLTGSQILTNKTIAAASNTISGLTNSNLSGSAAISNTNLANSTVNFGGVIVSLGSSDTTPAFDLSDAINYPTSSLSGTITNAQLAGSIENSKLSNSTITIVDDSSTAATIDLGSTLKIAGSGVTTSISGDTLTITGASLSYSTGTFTGDGSTVGFTINSGRSVDDMLVFVNGICLVPTDDYTISSTTLTFATAPAVSAEITFRYLPI